MRTEQVLGWASPQIGGQGAQLVFDDAGELRSLRLAGGEEICAGLRFAGVRHSGRLEAWSPEQVQLDVDEVEARGRCGGVQVRMRHTLDRTWQIRLQLHNDTDAEVELDAVVLQSLPGADAVGTVLATGALALLGWQRITDGPGPRCLGMRLGRGDLLPPAPEAPAEATAPHAPAPEALAPEAHTPDVHTPEAPAPDVHAPGAYDPAELVTPSLRLGPGERYTLSLHGEWYDRVDQLTARLPQWFPVSLDLTAADPELELEHLDGACEWPHPDGPLRTLRVADAEGITHLPVGFADEEAAVATVLDAVSRAGRVRSATEALVLLRAAGLRLDPGAEVDGLLIDYCERTPDAPSPAQLMVWTGESLRRGVSDPATAAELVQRASRLLPELAVQPGYGPAVLNLWVQQRLAGDLPQEEGVRPGMVRWLSGPEAARDVVTTAELGLLLGTKAPEPVSRANRITRLVATSRPAEALVPQPGSETGGRTLTDAELARIVTTASIGGRAYQDLTNRVLARTQQRLRVDPLDPGAVEALAWLAGRQ